MSAEPHQLGHDAPGLPGPMPDTPVFAADRVRPGTREADLARFGDLRWQLAVLDHGASGRSQAINWQGFPVSLRAGFMRAGWAVINLPTPEILLRRPGSSTRPRLSPGSLKRTFSAWGRFARWLARHQVTRLDQVGRSLLEKYPQFLAERGLTHGPVTTEMFAITRLWAYAPFLLPADRLRQPSATGQLCGRVNRPGRQLTRARAGLRRTAAGAGTLHRCGNVGRSRIAGFPGDHPVRTAPARPVGVLDRHLRIRRLGCVADGGHRQRCDRIYHRVGRMGFPAIRARDGGGRHCRAAGPRRYRGPGPDGGR